MRERGAMLAQQEDPNRRMVIGRARRVSMAVATGEAIPEDRLPHYAASGHLHGVPSGIGGPQAT